MINQNKSNKASRLFIMCLLLSTCLISCLQINETPKEKIGKHLKQIKEIHDRLSQNKLDTKTAATKMLTQVQAIQKLCFEMSDSEPRKDAVNEFAIKWNSSQKILGSLTDGKSDFISHVNYLFYNGFGKQKDGWKTLFPIFKP
ncbi:MAG TPA: hypothetical protein PKD85_02430 [Saprospiraceae bacterium]|nr:hypothetical protein [Saprospiraceae bacterium]